MLEEDIKQIVKRKKIDRYLVESTNNYYDHITFSITSLSEFVKIIESITTLKQYPNYFFSIVVCLTAFGNLSPLLCGE